MAGEDSQSDAPALPGRGSVTAGNTTEETKVHLMGPRNDLEAEMRRQLLSLQVYFFLWATDHGYTSDAQPQGIALPSPLKKHVAMWIAAGGQPEPLLADVLERLADLVARVEAPPEWLPACIRDILPSRQPSSDLSRSS